MKRPDPPINLDSFSGVANVPPNMDVPRGALREAVNVDLSAQGKAKRRRGYLRIDEDGGHSLFSCSEGMLAVINGELRLYDSNMDHSVLRSGLPDIPVAYAETPLGTFWMNGIDGGLIYGGEIHPIWPEAAGQPSVSAVAGTGGLDAGAYQVAMTWSDSLGRESGSTLAEFVNVPEGGGIQLDIPASSLPSANIYITNANDDKLRLRRTISTATSSTLIGRLPAGRVLDKQFMEPLPVGHICAFIKGRLMVGHGRWVYISEPYAYGLGLPDTRSPMPSDIDMIAEGTNGVFLAGGKRVYFASGNNPDQWSVRSVHGHGVVRGTAIMVPGKMLGDNSRDFIPYWLSKSGYFCIGRSDGTVETIKDMLTVANEDASSGASLVREQGGFRQIITTIVGGRINRAMASDEAVAEVRRNGITI